MSLIGIAAVERETGISKDTLRIWERRYGFPAPLRDGLGERVYPAEQVQRLCLLKRLLDAGHRPGRVVPVASLLPGDELDGASGGRAQGPQDGHAVAPSAANSALLRYLELLRSHDVEGLRRALSQALLRMGLGAFVLDLVAPLTTQVGEDWMRGRLEIFEEHICTEALQQVLRQALQAIPQMALAEQPRVLLTTLPGEPHGLGLLMAEALLTLEGCRCLSLGVQTPQNELPRAARAHRADIVALSFSGYLTAPVIQRALLALRGQLDPAIELWVGGRGLAPRQRRPGVAGVAGVDYVIELLDVVTHVRRWRDSQAVGAAVTLQI